MNATESAGLKKGLLTQIRMCEIKMNSTERIVFRSFERAQLLAHELRTLDQDGYTYTAEQIAADGSSVVRIYEADGYHVADF